MITDAWMRHATCRQTGPGPNDQWFPEKGRNCVTTARTAKETCDHCPVKQRCIDHALAYDEQWGIWGGVNLGRTTGRDRDHMREERGIIRLTKTERTEALLNYLGEKDTA